MSGLMALGRIGAFFRKPLTLVSILFLVLAAIVWFALPLIAIGESRPFEDPVVRLAIVLVLTIVWGAIAAIAGRRPAADDSKQRDAMRREEAERRAKDEAASVEAESRNAAIRRRIAEAVSHLARGKPVWARRRAAYRLPFYLLAGPSGAGKTAFVLDSGLDLPFGIPRGVAVGEPGGEPQVLISDRAVFVEAPDMPAGRDARHEGGDPSWRGLLDALRRVRPLQPLSGIFLVLDIPSLAALGEEERRALVRNHRRRLDEATGRLRSRPPVYVVFTKLDELVGFDAFFETLERKERDAPFGFSLLAGENDEATISHEHVRDELSRLAGRVGAGELARLQDEPDVRQRSLIHEFPVQFAVLADILVPVLGSLAMPHEFGRPPYLRGVFFVSGRQDKTAIDLVGEDIGAEFGQGNGLPRPSGSDGAHSRPFFLSGLIGSLALQDAPASGLSRSGWRAARLQRWALAGVIAAVVLVVAAGWWNAYRDAEDYALATSAQASEARQAVEGVPPAEGLPPLREILPVLDELRMLAEIEVPSGARYVDGVAQVEQDSRAVYASGLERLFVPYLMVGVEIALADPQTPAAELYQELKLYLALSGVREPAALDLDVISSTLENAWLGRFSQGERASFSRHVAALGRFLPSRQESEAEIVSMARERLGDYTLSQLAYDLARQRPQILALPGFRPSANASGTGARVLARTTGEGLATALPGIFTKEAFRGIALPTLRAAAEEIANGAWIFGTRERFGPSDSDAINTGAGALYAADYVRAYDGLLSELAPVPLTTPAEGARVVRIAISSPSPIAGMMAAIGEETELIEPPDPEQPLAAAGSLPSLAGSAEENSEPAQAVTDAFADLRAATRSNGEAPSGLQTVLAAFDPLYEQLNHIATGGDILELGTSPQTVATEIDIAIDGLPSKMQPVLRRLAEDGLALVNGTSGDRLRAIWSSTVLPACAAAIDDRFPFNPRARADTPFGDFAALFAPDGRIATFRDTYLKNAIDMSTKPWRWRPGRAEALAVDPAALTAFEHADTITRAFFANGEIGAAFTAEITDLSSRARTVRLDVGGQTLRYAHGPGLPLSAAWPPATPGAPAALSMTPEVESRGNMLVGEGPWALFRLLEQARQRRLVDGNVLDARFVLAGRPVTARLTPAATENPFALGLLDRFRCPRL